MIKLIISACLLFIFRSVAFSGENDNELFVDETLQLQQRLGILGLAGVIVENGKIIKSFSSGIAGDSDQNPFTENTPIEVASITKALTAVLIKQAAERGELRYGDFISQFDPTYNTSISPYSRTDEGPPDISVHNIVTHTSEGLPGEDFVYSSSRYQLLATALEDATNQNFKDLMSARILNPAGMIEYSSPNLEANNGLVTSANELAKFAIALDKENILDLSQQIDLCEPVTNMKGDVLPIGLGMFSQEILNFRVCWSYGQGENSSAILVRLPREKVTLIIVANSNALTDPFRLFMAKIQRSPFVMNFIRYLVAKTNKSEPLPKLNFGLQSDELKVQIKKLNKKFDYPYEEDLINELLVRRWLKQNSSEEIAHLIISEFPNAIKEDGVIQFALQQMHNPFFMYSSIEIGETLVKKYPLNRWYLYVLANAYLKTGNFEKAALSYERINSLPNQNSDPLFRELFLLDSKLELANIYMKTKRQRARKLLTEILKLDVPVQARLNAQKLLAELE